MNHNHIITALSLLASGSLTLVGCDKDRPVTEVPAAADEDAEEEDEEPAGPPEADSPDLRCV